MAAAQPAGGGLLRDSAGGRGGPPRGARPERFAKREAVNAHGRGRPSPGASGRRRRPTGGSKSRVVAASSLPPPRAGLSPLTLPPNSRSVGRPERRGERRGSRRTRLDDVQIVALDGARNCDREGARGGSARALRSRASRPTPSAGWRTPRRRIRELALGRRRADDGLHELGDDLPDVDRARRPRRDALQLERRVEARLRGERAEQSRGPRAPTRTGSCSARSLRRGRSRARYEAFEARRRAGARGCTATPAAPSRRPSAAARAGATAATTPRRPPTARGRSARAPRGRAGRAEVALAGERAELEGVAGEGVHALVLRHRGGWHGEIHVRAAIFVGREELGCWARAWRPRSAPHWKHTLARARCHEQLRPRAAPRRRLGAAHHAPAWAPWQRALTPASSSDHISPTHLLESLSPPDFWRRLCTLSQFSRRRPTRSDAVFAPAALARSRRTDRAVGSRRSSPPSSRIRFADHHGVATLAALSAVSVLLWARAVARADGRARAAPPRVRGFHPTFMASRGLQARARVRPGCRSETRRRSTARHFPAQLSEATGSETRGYADSLLFPAPPLSRARARPQMKTCTISTRSRRTAASKQRAKTGSRSPDDVRRCRVKSAPKQVTRFRDAFALVLLGRGACRNLVADTNVLGGSEILHARPAPLAARPPGRPMAPTSPLLETYDAIAWQCDFVGSSLTVDEATRFDRNGGPSAM